MGALQFRSTKDLDIVLLLESLDDRFLERFWEFVKAGEYETGQHQSRKTKLIRFLKPKAEGYPFMLELFSRSPEQLVIPPGQELVPIPGDDASSLSAILMDNGYYKFVNDMKTTTGSGVPVVPPECLIPLKITAFLDLTRRKAEGEKVDSKDLKKHKNDVFRLLQLLTPGNNVAAPARVGKDVARFIEIVEVAPVNLKVLRVPMKLDEALGILRTIYCN